MTDTPNPIEEIRKERIADIDKMLHVDQTLSQSDLFLFTTQNLARSIDREGILLAKVDEHQKWFKDHLAILATHRIGGFGFVEDTDTTPSDWRGDD